MPADSRAFRFLFPTLLVASVNQAFLWDISTAQLSLTIENTSHDFLPLIMYVELSDHLVFICFVGVLRIFSHHDGRPVYDLHISSLRCGDIKHQACLARKQSAKDDRLLVEQAIEPQKLDFTAVYANSSFLAGRCR